MIVQVRNAYKAYASDSLFEDLNLTIKSNEKVAIIGANGIGKTTLFRVLAHKEELDKGSVFWKGKLRVGFLEQTHTDYLDVSVREYFADVFADVMVIAKKMQALEARMVTDFSPKTLENYDRLQTEFLQRNGYNTETEIHTMMTQFGFVASDLERRVGSFSGGQITRIDFIKLLLSKPDVLFLDEPTNHLDISTVEWLEGYLAQYSGTVVVISHDRLFLDRVCQVTIEIEAKKAVRYESNYSGYIKLKDIEIEKHNVRFHNQQKEIERLEKLIEKFRYKKNKAAFAQSKIKYLDRMEKIEKRDDQKKQFRASFKANLRGGKDVLMLKDLSVGYQTPLFSMSHTFKRGHRYAIIGDNGTGKSTLLKTISDRMHPLSGEMLLGHQIEIGYFDQQLLDFTQEKTVLEEVWDAFPDLDHTQIRTSLGRFLFSQEDVFKSVSVLSGGEKVRLSLIKLMLAQDNLLILDEPTNHLDILGKEALESALKDYDGTMIFVSHDRYFIDQIATDILRIKEGNITHLETKIETILAEESRKNEAQKDENKANYVNLKQLARKQKKLEEELSLLHEELERHRQLRFDPDYYHDYQNMNELDQTIDDIHNQIKQRESEWEKITLSLEESEA